MRTNFWSHCYECSKKPNYSGQQYFLKRGDYSDFLRWFGLCNSMRPCHVIPQNSVSHKIQLCEKDELQGQMLELTSDSLSVPGYIHLTEIFFLDVLARLHAHLNHCNSVKVETGCWTIYECPNYIGHQYFLRKGEYPDYQHWMGFNDSISTCIITAVIEKTLTKFT
ncbi:unnamed protein product [Bubo scandiacus]